MICSADFGGCTSCTGPGTARSGDSIDSIDSIDAIDSLGSIVSALSIWGWLTGGSRRPAPGTACFMYSREVQSVNSYVSCCDAYLGELVPSSTL